MKITICILTIFLSGCFWQTPSKPVRALPSGHDESKPKPKPPKPKPSKKPTDPVPVDDSVANVTKKIEEIFSEAQTAHKGRIKYAETLAKYIMALVGKIDEAQEKDKLFSNPWGDSGKTLVGLMATMPIIDKSIEAINFIKKKSSPEQFMFQLGGGDVNTLINELLRRGRRDDSSTEMKKLFGIMVQAFRENNKKFPVEPANAMAILDLIKDDKDNLKSIFAEVAQNQALEPQLFQWVGVNVEHQLVRGDFAKIYKTFSEDKKLLARSNVLLGIKNNVGNKDFIGKMEEHAGDLGLDSLKDLNFDTSSISKEKIATLAKLRSQPATDILPTTKAMEFEKLANTSRNQVKDQAILVEYEAVDPKVTGLVNVTRNSCFLNAITQTLLHTREINQLLTYYIKNNGLHFFGDDRKFPLLESLANLAKEYRKSDGSVRPENWTKLSMSKTVEDDCQHDANDFFTQLYDKMDKELNVVTSPPEKYSLKDFERGDPKFVRNYLQSYGASILNKWLMGFEQLELTLHDNKVNKLYNAITGLELSFPLKPKQPEQPELKEFLDEYFDHQPPPDERPDIKSQKTTLVVAPKILRISLKRFEFDKSTKQRKKITTKVAYQAVLKINVNGSEKIYDLYSVVQQDGGVDGGHYWADIKAGDDQWYNVNDSSVSLINEATALSRKSDAYMFFYRMRE